MHPYGTNSAAPIRGNLLRYPQGYRTHQTEYLSAWTFVNCYSPAGYGGDFGFGYSPSAHSYYFQNVVGFRIGKTYNASITITNYSNGTLRLYIDDGALVAGDISGNGTYNFSFVATKNTHQFKVWAAAKTVTMAEVNMKFLSVGLA